MDVAMDKGIMEWMNEWMIEQEQLESLRFDNPPPPSKKKKKNCQKFKF